MQVVEINKIICQYARKNTFGSFITASNSITNFLYNTHHTLPVKQIPRHCYVLSYGPQQRKYILGISLHGEVIIKKNNHVTS